MLDLMADNRLFKKKLSKNRLTEFYSYHVKYDLWLNRNNRRDRVLIVSKAKTIEGSSATNKAGGWKGTGRRTKGQEKTRPVWTGFKIALRQKLLTHYYKVRCLDE